MLIEKDTTDSTRPNQNTTMRRRQSPLKFIILALSYLIVAVIVWQISENWQSDPVRQQELAAEEIKETVEDASKLMLLPTVDKELPQIVVVTDAENMSKTQPFLVDVKNGDRVLIYLQSQRAVIYRPGENRIINAGTITTESQAKITAPASKPVTSEKKTTPDTESKDN